ncbi:MAG: hypothetical protein KDA60_05325 [Planctomycetales bacterium]|nr:hypothetical protein [Planctomycetales bacterium]
MIRPNPKATYEPTPEEIREACLEIQAGWSDDDRNKRRYGTIHGAPVLLAAIFNSRIFDVADSYQFAGS